MEPLQCWTIYMRLTRGLRELGAQLELNLYIFKLKNHKRIEQSEDSLMSHTQLLTHRRVAYQRPVVGCHRSGAWVRAPSALCHRSWREVRIRAKITLGRAMAALTPSSDKAPSSDKDRDMTGLQVDKMFGYYNRDNFI